MGLAIVNQIKKSLEERRRGRPVPNVPEEKIEILKINEIFLTDKLSRDGFGSRKSSPQTSEFRNQSTATQGILNNSKSMNTNQNKNRVVQPPPPRLIPKINAIVNFNMKKNELMSTHIISNIKNILKSIETRKDLNNSSRATYSRSTIRRCEQRSSDTNSNRMIFKALEQDPAKNMNSSLIGVKDNRPARAFQPKFQASNDLSVLKDTMNALNQFTNVERPKNHRGFISSFDKENLENRKSKYKKRQGGSEKELHVDRSAMMRSSHPRKTEVLTETDAGHQETDMARRLPPSGSQKNNGLLTDLPIPGVRDRLARQRRQRFLIRSNTNNLGDRRLQRQPSGGSLVEEKLIN